MPVVFDYTDFRKFLKDYYTEQKKAFGCFSYKYFASRAGFANKGFVYNLVNGDKRLSKTHVFKLCAAMKLDKSEFDYFDCMVAFNQAESTAERTYFFKQMEAINAPARKRTKAQLVRKDQFEFYSKWHHGVVRSLVDMDEKANDPKWIAQRVMPPISVWDARHSLRLLKRLGMIKRAPDGSYTVKTPVISTGHDVRNVALYAFYLQHLQLAAEALQKLPREKRNFNGITMGISQKTYARVCSELQSFMEKMMTIAEEDEHADSVYQLNFQCYPMTNSDGKEERNA
jgi:uncharacterized protein (TIGR02147 family)